MIMLGLMVAIFMIIDCSPSPAYWRPIDDPQLAAGTSTPG
jgi:hypothetical protein